MSGKHRGIPAAEKYAELERLGEERPKCECHGEPMRWNKRSSASGKGGYWTCSVKSLAAGVAYTKKMVALGFCSNCKKRPPAENYLRCNSCRERDRHRYVRNRDRTLQLKREMYRENEEYREKHLARCKEYRDSNRRIVNLRKKVYWYRKDGGYVKERLRDLAAQREQILTNLTELELQKRELMAHDSGLS